MDIIDFRYRPPYGSYRETIMYRDLERARRCSEAFGMTQSPAVAARDMEASLTEMDRAGIGMAVLAGRKVLPHIGIVDNQDIVDLIHAYPGRFTGMAGVDPSDGPEAMEELERYVVGEGLRGIVMEPGLTKTPMFVEDERIFPLYERCQALGVPVMLMVGSNCGPDIEYSKPEHAIHVAYRYKNVYLLPDLYQFNGPGSGEYLAAANYILRDQMLFGSAYPYVSLREAVDYFLEGRLRPEAQPAFLAGNARRILELERV